MLDQPSINIQDCFVTTWGKFYIKTELNAWGLKEEPLKMKIPVDFFPF